MASVTNMRYDLAIKVPNANWPESKRKLCGPGLSNPDIAKRGVGLTNVKIFGGCEKLLKVIMAPLKR